MWATVVYKQRAGVCVGATADWGQEGAYVEHAAHFRDAGRIEAERLVELKRGLPRGARRA